MKQKGTLRKSLVEGANVSGLPEQDLELMAQVMDIIEERAHWVPGITTGPPWSWEKDKDITSILTASFYERERPIERGWGRHRRLSMEIRSDGTFDLGII